MIERLADGEWILKFSSNHLRSYLDQHGEMPLPPYIKRPSPRAADLNRYQTVYAEKEGAVAAPTAGFHFTPQLFERIHTKGVMVRSLVLHVGWGTFRPVRAGRIEDHQMLPEAYEVSELVVRDLNQARREGRRIVAVGTTAVRTLETVCDAAGIFHAGRGSAELFIYPGYRFKAVDALITNFHLPDSTPLLLACAFYGGNPSIPFSLRFAYEEAIREGYRFYSYGDAMFIQ
jgi:S-adenosylmethionine:tRNA ribosyltransferase-isomerase